VSLQKILILLEKFNTKIKQGTKIVKFFEMKVRGKYSFIKGWLQVKNMDLPIVRKEIESAIGLTSEGAWYFRLNGKTEPKISEAKIFAKRGITDIWGELETEVVEYVNNTEV